MSFGEKLKKIRLDRNLTLSEVSKAINIGKSSRLNMKMIFLDHH